MYPDTSQTLPCPAYLATHFHAIALTMPMNLLLSPDNEENFVLRAHLLKLVPYYSLPS